MDIIKGIVIPVGWDLNGNIVKLAIATGDEQEYLIENQLKIAQLKTLLRQEVVVSGSIRDKKEYKAIKIASIRQEKPNEYYRLSQQLPMSRNDERRNLADFNYKQFV